MPPENNPVVKPSWLKDILNGFLAWLIAFLLYILPGLAVGFSMGFDLGPRLNNNAEVSRQIGQAISEMYQTGWYLHLGFLIAVAILVFWRAWVRTRYAAEKSILHGVAIGATAAILAIVQVMSHGIGWHAVMSAVACIAAGALGGWKRKPGPHAE